MCEQFDLISARERERESQSFGAGPVGSTALKIGMQVGKRRQGARLGKSPMRRIESN